jgi:hypothetical protein
MHSECMPERNRQLGRLSSRCVYNIGTMLKKYVMKLLIQFMVRGMVLCNRNELSRAQKLRGFLQ